MGEVNLGGLHAWRDTLIDRLDSRLSAFADKIEEDAQRRAPIRKPGRKRGKKREFAPMQVYRFGAVKLSTAEITSAANRIGIKVSKSLAHRKRVGLEGGLTIQERRPDRRVKIDRNRVDYKKYKTVPDPFGHGTVLRITRPDSSAAKEEAAHRNRMARQFETQRMRRAAQFMGQVFDEATGTITDIEDNRPGRLRRSIAAEFSENSDSHHIIYTVRAGAPYARYVEFPTYQTRAQPFLLPAFKTARARLRPWMSGTPR